MKQLIDNINRVESALMRNKAMLQYNYAVLNRKIHSPEFAVGGIAVGFTMGFLKGRGKKHSAIILAMIETSGALWKLSKSMMTHWVT